jgi:signal transduction histidine kinase
LEATDTDFTVEVQDHGDGIAPERQKDIFCRFSQIGGDKSSVVRGTGLGLSIVKEIVNQQGGQIFVESALGVGSRFSVVFPLKGARKGTESLGASAA